MIPTYTAITMESTTAEAAETMAVGSIPADKLYI